MSYFDKYVDRAREKAVEWDVEGKADKFGGEVVKAAEQARDKAATVADDNRDKVVEWLDSMAAKIDEKTKGQYAEHVSKAKVQVTKGVDKLAEQRPGGSARAGAPGPADTPQDAPASEWSASQEAGPEHQDGPGTQTSRDTNPPPQGFVG